jgi:hypothetical protein
MAKKQAADPFFIPTVPQWETRAKRPFTDGRWPGINNSLWLWRAVPMASVTDASSDDQMVSVGVPLSAAFEELAKLSGRGSNRNTARRGYREFQAILVNIPTLFTAPQGTPITDYLNRNYGDISTMRRVLLFGVKLRDSVTSGSWRDAIRSAAETLQYGGAPLSDFDKDAEIVSGALSRAGFRTPELDEMRLVDSWWNRGGSAGIPVLTHAEHMHFFSTVEAAQRSVKVDPSDCALWPEQENEHAISFATVERMDLRYADATTPIARWVTPLLDAGARVLSIRGLVEPSKVTRNELRGQHRRYQADLDELAMQSKMNRAEMDERRNELSQIEAAYAQGSAPATLVDTSIIVGFDGVIADIKKVEPDGITLSPMMHRQAAAWHETMVCSSVRANPYLHDLPASTIAFSALPSISKVGDEAGALLGFTERDRQPVFISPRAASEGDASPLFGVFGASGSGKTQLLQFLADQYHRSGIPQVVVNPKAGDSLRDALEPAGAVVATLDSFITSDGVLDPIRIFDDPQMGVQKATSMIATVNPYGPDVSQYMTALAYAINWGVENGAKATGQALQMAVDAGKISAEFAEPVFKYAQVYPMFRATFGMSPEGEALKLSDGTTLIEVGQTSFELPNPSFNKDISEHPDPTVRNSMNIIRMLIWGSMNALRHRGGAAVHFDESWVMELAAPGDLDQIGRLARSWDVLPILYTQKPSLQRKIGLKGYLSRGLIGHISDPDEVDAVLDIFSQSDNDEMRRRIPAPQYLSGGAGLNPDSLRHLPNPKGTPGVARGAVFYHVDMKNRVAPVEVTLSEEFLRISSTNPDDVRRRRELVELDRASRAAGV